MTIAFRSRWGVVVLTVFLLLSLLFAWQQKVVSQDEVYDAEAVAALAEHGLHRSSEDLTRMVRLYTITGDPLYREYFNEILAIRNGEAPRPQQYFSLPWWELVLATGERPTEPGETESLREIFSAGGLSEGELALLVESEDQSNELAALENEIMDVVAAQVGPDGEYVLEGAALEAMQRLHSAEYYAAKTKVLLPLTAFVELTHVNEEAECP